MEYIHWLQTTQPTSGVAVTAESSCCANCVEPPRPQQWEPDLPFFVHAGHADPLDGWRCCSQKRVMSRPIQVRQLQTIKSGFVISAIYKYMSESTIRCNRIEHLRCAGIRQAQYTDTWTCHLHRKSRLTPHTDITPPHRSRPLSKPPTHSSPTPPTPTPPQPKHRHMSNTPPVPRGLVKPKPNSLIHSPPSPPTPPRAKHIHMSHTPPSPLTSTSPVLDKTPEPRVPLIHALTATTPHPDPTPALPSPSHRHTLTAHTHATQTTVHASQSPQQPHAQHRVLRQPHKQTKDYHRTTNTTQTHRPSCKSERNLIIL